jgi:hypothetical protein
MTGAAAETDMLTDTASLVADVIGAVDPVYRKRLGEVRRKVAECRFVVVVCGEFKQGKSTLLNALLESPDLLPVDIDITTSVPTVVTYGQSAAASVTFADGTAKPIAVGDIRDYVTEDGNPRNSLGVRWVEVQLPQERLARGIVLVDTPGIGGLNVEHTAATLEYLVNADAVLFVASAADPLTTRDLDFLADAARYSDLLVIAVTKIDLRPRPEVVVEDTRLKVAERLEIPLEELTVVPVSSKRKLNGLREHDAALIARSGFPDLEDELWGGIRRRAGAAIVLQAIEEVGRALDLAANPIGTEIVALETDSAVARERMGAELEALRQRVAELEDSTADWRSTCAATLDELRTSVLDLFEVNIGAVRRGIDAYVSDANLVDNPEALGSRVVRDVRLALADADVRLRRGVTELVVQLRRQSAFDLTDPRLSVLSFDPINGLSVPPAPERATVTRRVLDAGPKALAGGKVFRRLGLVIGGALAAVGAVVAVPVVVIGGVVAAGATIAGTVLGFRNSLAQADESAGKERIATLTACATAYLDDNHRRARLVLEESVGKARNQVVADLEDRLRAEQQSLRAAEGGLRRAAMAGAGNADHLRALKESLAALGALQTRAGVLLSRAMAGR